MLNHYSKIKTFSLGSFIFSLLSLISLVLMILGLKGVFITYVKENDTFYEFLFYRDFLIADNGILYTEYFSWIAGNIFIGIFLIFFIFSIFFRISLFICILSLSKKGVIENKKINFLLISKLNIFFGIVCGLILLSTLSILVDEKKGLVNELL